MKLTTLIIVAAILQVSASTFAQKITLSEKNTPLNKVFEKVREQTGFDFIVSTENLKKAKAVTINVQNEELKLALDKIFAEQPLQFIVQDKMVVVSKRSALTLTSKSEPIEVVGKVTDSLGNALSGATLKIVESNNSFTTNNKGEFKITANAGETVLVTYIGYNSFSFVVNRTSSIHNIVLSLVSSKLEQVSIVSTGYQNISKERATGSFVKLDNGLLNRSVSTNILDRLNGVTSGLIFNDNGNHQFGQSNIEIRGRATLFSNPDPLIIMDNFPYDGDLNNINPNDIESITILKDAAAASAWGARSGNGVIVLTTKKGRLNSGPTVSINSNITIGAKPNLYYTPQLTSSQYIGVQQFLFNQGAYDSAIANGYSALPPAVEVFFAKRNGVISTADSVAALNKLRSYDSRQQISKYYYRPSVNQQYQASISGGEVNQKYFVSAGYDKNLNNFVNSSYNRISLNASNTYYFLKKKLEVYSNIVYTGSTTKSGPVINQTLYPYDQIAGGDGSHLAIANNLRPSYASAAGSGQLLNWLYNPLDELKKGYSNTNTNLADYRVNLSLTYKIIPGLTALALYNYEKGITESDNLNEYESYYTRNLINTYTQIDPISGVAIYPIPRGDILYTDETKIHSNNGRFQLNYDKTWGNHALTMIAGVEIKDYSTFANTSALYGYNSQTATNQNSAVNYTAFYPFYYGFDSGQIPTNTAELGVTNRFFSYYFNGAYTYNDKYILSVSGRRDESNLFGVSINQKGIPLWSSGLSWIVNKESFYNVGWLPQLKVRATFGYTGNVNNSLSAYLTAIPGITTQTYNVPYTRIINPPNPSLRWELDQNINIGLDFSAKNGIISGSIDFWRKNGDDLIGNSPIAPQTGVVLFTGNSANTSTKGIDLVLSSVNLNGRVKWLTTFLYNFNHSLVTSYKVSNGTNYNVISANYNNPLQGYPFYSIFSFKYAGLNATGDPQGYLNGATSIDYNAIANSTNHSELVYNGSATPTSFGSLRNTFSYKDIELSFNITYKLGYYFRRNSLDNNALYSTGGNNYKFADFDSRWQKPGDELHTNVPSLVYPSDGYRTALYTYSNALVEKADQVRLQDIRLSYKFPPKYGSVFKSLTAFTYLNNIGILWRANKYHIDPDYASGIPMPRTIAFGIKGDL